MSGQRILLGVTGGIAAFKAAEIVRGLRERGHEVRCAVTRAAESFVAPLTLEVLSGQRVYREEYLSPGVGGEELHIAAASWAQVLCIAPATAHALARLALGLADDFLTTTALAHTGPCVLAPAMHERMWSKPQVQAHVDRLRALGAILVGPVEGRLASGEIGMGRMAEPAAIVDAIERATAMTRDLAGRRVLVTAGPTHEPIDPVRFLGNRSSGKMGFALAAEAARRGARVVLIAGPVALATPPDVERIDVETALEMAAAVARHAPGTDLVVMAAAVADFRPRSAANRKIKKETGAPALDLVANPDILSGLAALAPGAIRVGFAAETAELETAAMQKLVRKDAHLLVANDVSRSEIGFGSDDNEVTVFRRQGPSRHFERSRKGELARRLMDLFAEELRTRARQPADAPA